MSTKLPRLSVTFPVDLFTTIKKDAELNARSDSNQVVWILRQYYMEKRKEADLFTLSPLREARRGAEPPLFETPDLSVHERLSKPRKSVGQDEK